jgi:hypothetical protein
VAEGEGEALEEDDNIPGRRSRDVGSRTGESRRVDDVGGVEDRVLSRRAGSGVVEGRDRREGVGLVLDRDIEVGVDRMEVEDVVLRVGARVDVPESDVRALRVRGDSMEV